MTRPAASDSREVVPGGMFAAGTGAHVDGHGFAADTITVAPDRHAAANLLRDQLSPGDIVLVKASWSLQLEDLATTLAAGPATPASRQQ